MSQLGNKLFAKEFSMTPSQLSDRLRCCDDIPTRTAAAEMIDVLAQSLRPMKCLPVGEEVLAWHREGRTWHQVHRDGPNMIGMRWNDKYRQYDGDFAGWVYLPPQPSI